MSRAKLLADLEAASADYATAQWQLAEAQFSARHGMAHSLTFAESRAHVAYHRWLRAGEAYSAVAPKPAIATKLPPKASTIAPRDPGAEAVANYWRR